MSDRCPTCQSPVFEYMCSDKWHLTAPPNPLHEDTPARQGRNDETKELLRSARLAAANSCFHEGTRNMSIADSAIEQFLYELAGHGLRIEAASRLSEQAKRIEELTMAVELKSAQAYQVIGTLLDRTGEFESDEGQRALDYFSGDEVTEDFLPWPRAALQAKE